MTRTRLRLRSYCKYFLGSHDPTTLDQQGNDVGPQYRSAIFYTTPRQKEKAEHYIMVMNKGLGVKKIVTEVAPLKKFYPAEDYHKNYFANNRGANYCQLVIAPKVEKVGEKFKSLLK